MFDRLGNHNAINLSRLRWWEDFASTDHSCPFMFITQECQERIYHGYSRWQVITFSKQANKYKEFWHARHFIRLSRSVPDNTWLSFNYITWRGPLFTPNVQVRSNTDICRNWAECMSRDPGIMIYLSKSMYLGLKYSNVYLNLEVICVPDHSS